jgi:hypothetical protein
MKQALGTFLAFQMWWGWVVMGFAFARSGRLDFLVQEAVEEKNSGKLRDL